MTNLTILSQLLRAHYPDPSPEVATYLNAYEQRTHDNSANALRAVMAAWNALTEDERRDIGLVLDGRA